MRPQLTVAAFINYGTFFIQVYTEHILQRLLLFDRDRNYSFPIYMQSWTCGLVLNDPLTFLQVTEPSFGFGYSFTFYASW